MRKIDAAQQLFAKHVHILQCPLCCTSMKMGSTYQLVCVNQHSFDMAKQGYVNFLTKPSRTEYGKDLFESRRLMLKSPLYEQLTAAITSTVWELHQNSARHEWRVLDVGCGEGSYLSCVIQELSSNPAESDILGVGIDISKEGIFMAARDYPNLLWCVGDLAQVPFQRSQFDAILNIFSPSNSEEFKRLLREGGAVIKVVPGKDYLCQLRAALHSDTERENYSNDKVVNHFQEAFKMASCKQVRYTRAIDAEEAVRVADMSPLAWGVSPEKMKRVLDIQTLTIDAFIMVGFPI